jgi:hypothetical protein
VRNKSNKKEYREKVRANDYRKCYGITIADYDDMFKAQDGKCAICGTSKPHTRSDVRHFSIDHDHDTGQVRGLLCDQCNRGLGLLHDDIERLKSAIQYLSTKRNQ